MKTKLLVFLFAIGISAIAFQGCDPKCENPGQAINIGKEYQNFTLKYMDNSGGNWLNNPAVNLSNVYVERSVEGPHGSYNLHPIPVTQGRIGPEYYSVVESFDDSTGVVDSVAVLKGPYYQYRYKVHVDTFRVDLISVDFYPTVTECQEVWQAIKWSINGVSLDSLEDQQIAELVITTDTL